MRMAQWIGILCLGLKISLSGNVPTELRTETPARRRGAGGVPMDIHDDRRPRHLCQRDAQRSLRFSRRAPASGRPWSRPRCEPPRVADRRRQSSHVLWAVPRFRPNSSELYLSQRARVLVSSFWPLCGDDCPGCICRTHPDGTALVSSAESLAECAGQCLLGWIRIGLPASVTSGKSLHLRRSNCVGIRLGAGRSLFRLALPRSGGGRADLVAACLLV